MSLLVSTLGDDNRLNNKLFCNNVETYRSIQAGNRKGNFDDVSLTRRVPVCPDIPFMYLHTEEARFVDSLNFTFAKENSNVFSKRSDWVWMTASSSSNNNNNYKNDIDYNNNNKNIT